MSLSHKLSRVVAGLAAGCLVVTLVRDLPAQNSTKKKSSTVRPVEATDDEVSAPKPRPTNKTNGAGTKPAASANGGKAGSPTKASGEKASTQGKTGGSTKAREGASSEEGRRQRPEAEPMRVEKISPELEKILVDWEQHSAKVKKLTGSFKRAKYDFTFGVETWADGKFAYQAPDRGAYEFVGAKVGKDDSSQMKTAGGVPFELKSDQPEHWVCTGNEVLKIYDAKKEYERVAIPPESQGENIIEGPLPFLFGMKAEQAKRRYQFTLRQSPPDYENAITLKVIPREKRDSDHWVKALVILSRETYLPIAVKLTEPGEQSETVHKFEDLQVNGKRTIAEFLGVKSDPFEPNLSRFKLILNEKQGIPDSAARELPQDLGARPAAPAGTRGKAVAGESAGKTAARSADASGGAKKTGTKK